jgi:hypothetical protein
MKPLLAVAMSLLLPLAALAQAEKPAAKARKPAAEKAAPKPAATPEIGSLDASPERKLGTQKEPCVYKPVMTAEDMANCK